jgi:hypothetical protein
MRAAFGFALVRSTHAVSTEWNLPMASVRSKLLLAVLRLAAMSSAVVLGNCTLGYGNSAHAQNRSLSPIYWQEKLFYIPYQANQNDKLLQRVDKVQLLLSRDGSSDWRVLQEAKPKVKGFSYLADDDGDYWFALRHLDRSGKSNNSAALQPQLRIVVDTKSPELSLNAAFDLSGAIVVRYQAEDVNLDSDSLLLEVRTEEGTWTKILAAAHDVAQPDKLVGRANWQPPASASTVEVRATIADQTGRRAEAKSQLIVRGPTLDTPFVSHDTAANSQPVRRSHDVFPGPAQPRAQDWPATNQIARQIDRPSPTPQSSFVAPPPEHNSYSKVGTQSTLGTRAPAGSDVERYASTANAQPTGQARTPQSLGITPLDPSNAPLAENLHAMRQDGWTTSTETSSAGARLVNSRTFDVEYEIESAGPWGVSKVELWGTHDGGLSWQSYGIDSDNRSPLRVTVPGSGTYGFRIVVHGAGGAPAEHPRAGDQAELRVAVDLQPPRLELLNAELGQGDLAGHLSLKWTAADTNLEPHPIALFYSSQPSGPWSTIATGLENNGTYRWRIERHVPSRFYLRIEAHDTAGNQATYESPSPINLPRPQPTGRLRSVRPVVKSAEALRAS